MEDLSALARNSLTATSQGGGNMMSSNATAMTAPGSQPVTPLPPQQDQDTPNLEMSSEIPVSFTGKPDVTRQAGSRNPPAPAWKPASHPGVERIAPPAPPEPRGTATQASVGVAGPARGATHGRAGGVTGTTVNSIPGGTDN